MRLLSIGEFARQSRLSPKALRLYDELDILPPARTDPDNGYRWYDPSQLEQARMVALLRQVGLPLEGVRQVLEADPKDAVAFVRRHWERAQADHRARAGVVLYLVDRLEGRSPIMYEVATRQMPGRTVLCLKRHVASEKEVWDLGKLFLSYFRDRPRPLLPGRQGAPFLVYHGEVSADSDGPVEFCRPIPAADAPATAAEFPELELRTEPAHEEAVIHLGSDPADATSWAVVSESLHAWAVEHGRKPSDLGVRLTYLVEPPRRAESVPDVDFAAPLSP
jgi:DNA-binding transcriptional MerR regulator